MREKKVLSVLVFWENIVFGLAISVLCVLLIEAFLVPGTLGSSAKLGLTLIFFLCGFGIIKCWMLLRRRKSLLVEQEGALIYEHETERKGRSSNELSSYVLLPLFWVFFSVLNMRRLPHEHPGFWFEAAFWVLFGVFWILKLCISLFNFWGYGIKITIAVSGRKLNVSFPKNEGSLGENLYRISAAFPLDEIAEARIVAPEDPEIRQHAINEASGKLAIRPNVKRKSGFYQYALFLSDRCPLPDGHQAVDLTLRSGRNVLVETDDADNFLAALRNNGVGGDTDIGL